MAKGYTKVIYRSTAGFADNIKEAYMKLQARRKLATIPKTKGTKIIPVSVGNLGTFYRKEGKRGNFSEPKQNAKVNNYRK